MDTEKLIAGLSKEAYGSDVEELLLEAATALSTLQAENEKLRADVVRFNDMLASYQNMLVPELRAELEKVKEDWRRHGRWIVFDPKNAESKECSMCGYLFSRLYPSNYCPNCGARMDKEDEHEAG